MRELARLAVEAVRTLLDARRRRHRVGPPGCFSAFASSSFSPASFGAKPVNVSGRLATWRLISRRISCSEITSLEGPSTDGVALRARARAEHGQPAGDRVVGAGQRVGVRAVGCPTLLEYVARLSGFSVASVISRCCLGPRPASMLELPCWNSEAAVRLAKKACTSLHVGARVLQERDRGCAGSAGGFRGSGRSGRATCRGRAGPSWRRFVSGPSEVRNLSSWGANGLALCSSADRLRSAGRNSSRNGLASTGEACRVPSAPCVELRSKAGSSAPGLRPRCSLADAAALKVCSPLTIRPSSWWSRLASALKTTPVFLTRSRSAPSCVTRMPSSLLAFSANGSSCAKSALICSPRPLMPTATDCCQILNAARVFGSNVARMSSSVTDGSTLPGGKRPLSATYGPVWLCGISWT